MPIAIVSPATPEERDAQVAKWRAMSNLLLGAIPPDMPHNVVLEALLSVYIAVAEKHPCCTLAAGCCLTVAAQRVTLAALERPADSAVH